MALTGVTTVSILGTAGLSPAQYGLQLAVEAANKSVMMPLVRRYMIELGQALYIPKVGTRSATTRTRGTDDGVAPTYAALNDSYITMTEKFIYDALAIGWEALLTMPPAHLAAWLGAERTQMGAALANKMDTDLLALYSSATLSVGGAGTDVSWALIVDAIKKLRTANAPEPYFMVLPETQWDHLAGIDELTRYDARGEGDTIQNRQMFKAHGVQIFTTANVPTAGGIAHGLAFSGEGIALAVRNMVEVEDWRDQNTFSNKLAVWSDYAYANTFAGYLVDFQTTDA